MDENFLVLALLEQRKIKEYTLNQLVYGSVEIRGKDGNKYIYTHTRENGIHLTKYVGVHSDTLYKMIVENNDTAKILKKEIRVIDRKIKNLGYVDDELPKDVAINIDYAKKYLAKTIYQQALLEGVSTTFLQTENIIKGGIINKMSTEDVMVIINLKHSWDFILNKNIILSPTSFSILCSINRQVEDGFVYSAGMIRSTPVSIGGTEWKPPLPIESTIKSDLDEIINSRKDEVDIAIKLLLYVVRSQMFLDGNKRTSVIFANQYLISKGKGLIVIPEKKIEIYKSMLIDFYETNNDKEITNFLKTECYTKI